MKLSEEILCRASYVLKTSKARELSAKAAELELGFQQAQITLSNKSSKIDRQKTEITRLLKSRESLRIRNAALTEDLKTMDLIVNEIPSTIYENILERLGMELDE